MDSRALQSTTIAAPRVDVFFGANDRRDALRRDALAGLTATPKELPPKWFYDERGSALFAAITELPEYYLTRREREILAERAHEIVSLAAVDTLVELGAGTAEKTRVLLDAIDAVGTLRRVVVFDVSERTLRETAEQLAIEYAGAEVHGVVGDVDAHLGHIPAVGRRLVAFLGSSIGNFDVAARARFLRELREGLRAGDALLVGVDLVKDPVRLLAAYDDAAGVTAAFNRNVLAVLNRELGASFRLERFDHVARWVPEHEWIEMWLRSQVDQTVTLRELDLEVEFAAGEELRTEISAKFRRDGIEGELRGALFEPIGWWTDARRDFALSLSIPA